MNSNNGDLYFKAGIDIDDFNVSAKAMEDRMRQVSSTVVNESGNMDNAISQIGGAFTRLVGAGGAAAFVKQVFNVRSEMQQTEAMFRVFTGSAEKASEFMEKLQDYAYWNVFEFKDLAQQSAQLMAFGNDVDSIIPTLNSLSEIANVTKQPLEGLVDIWNKVKASDKMDAERIYQLGNYGVDVRQALAEIQSEETGMEVLKEDVDVVGLKFADLVKIIEHLGGEGGKFSGSMKESMDSLGDTMGLLQDNLTNMFDEIGKATQDYLKGGLMFANTLIDNYKEIAKVLATLVTAYGAVKAANIAMSIAQKNGTGVAVIDNTVWAVRSKLLNNQIATTGNVTRSIRTMRAVQTQEIATLKAQMTEEQHAAVIERSRIANINALLTAQQRQQLANIGVTESDKQYILIANSMLTADQRVALAKAELTNNTTAYIAALKGELAATTPNLVAMREKVKLAASEAETTLANATAKRTALVAAKQELATAIASGDQKKINIATSKVERLHDEYSAAAKTALAAQRKKNTIQAELETAAKKKSTIAGKAEAAADTAQTATKGILAAATGKVRKALEALWLSMKANPIGWVIGLVTALVLAIQRFKSKAEEAAEAEEELRQSEHALREESDKMAAQLEIEKNAIKDCIDKHGDEKKMVSELNDKYGEIFGTYQTLADWYDVLSQKSALYVDVLYKQALLNDAIAKARDTQNLIDDLKESPIDPGFWKSVGHSIKACGDYLDVFLSNLPYGVSDAAKDASDAFTEEQFKPVEERYEQINKLTEERKKILADAAKLQSEIFDLNSQLEGGKTSAEGSNKALTDDEKKKLAERRKLLEEYMATLPDLENELFEAQANLLPEGLEKRLKLIEAAYKKELLQISKDEEEAKKNREKAGLTLSETETAIFGARRQSAKNEKDEDIASAAEGEVDRMRGLYEQYYKWIEQMDKDSADKRFRNLIDTDKSYEEWLDSEIEKYNNKEGRNAAEDSYLENLVEAKNDYTGKKTSLQIFQEDTEKLIESAPSLAAKLELLKKKMKELKSVAGSDIEKQGMMLQLAQQTTETQEAIDKAFAEKYKNYADTRREAAESYQRDLERLFRDSGGKETFTIQQVKREMEQSLQGLDENFLKGIFSEVFTGKATTKALKKALADLKKMKGMSLDEFNSTYDIAFTEDQLESLKTHIDGVSDSLKEMGTYNIGDAFRDIRNGRIEGDLEKVARGTEHLKDVFGNFRSVVSQLSETLNDLAEATDNENLQNTAKTVESVSNVLESAGSWAATGASIGGGWGAVIGVVLGSVLGVVEEVINRNAEEEEQRQQDVEDAKSYMQEVIDGIGSMVSSIDSLNDTVSSLNYSNYRESLLEAINSMRADINYEGSDNWSALYDGVTPSGALGALDDDHINEVVNDLIGYLYSGSASRDQEFQNNTQSLIDMISGLSDEQKRELVEAWANGNIEDWLSENAGLSDRMAGYWEGKLNYDDRSSDSVRRAYANQENGKDYELEQRRLGLLRELNELYESGSVSSLEYFNLMLKSDQLSLDLLERRKKEMEDSGLQDTEEYLELINEIETLKYNMSQRVQDMAEGLWGTDIESIIENWIDIFDEFGDDVEGAFAKIDESIDEMINNLMLKTIVMEPMMQRMSKIFSDYAAEVGEDHQYTKEDFIELARRLGQVKEDFWNQYQAYLEATDDVTDGTDVDSESLTGSIQNVSEETAGIIAGRMNAIVINQAESTSVLRQSLITQIEIRNYTAQIADDVSVIRQKVDQKGLFNSNLNYGLTE